MIYVTHLLPLSINNLFGASPQFGIAQITAGFISNLFTMANI